MLILISVTRLYFSLTFTSILRNQERTYSRGCYLKPIARFGCIFHNLSHDATIFREVAQNCKTCRRKIQKKGKYAQRRTTKRVILRVEEKLRAMKIVPRIGPFNLSKSLRSFLGRTCCRCASVEANSAFVYSTRHAGTEQFHGQGSVALVEQFVQFQLDRRASTWYR